MIPIEVGMKRCVWGGGGEEGEKKFKLKIPVEVGMKRILEIASLS